MNSFGMMFRDVGIIALDAPTGELVPFIKSLLIAKTKPL